MAEGIYGIDWIPQMRAKRIMITVENKKDCCGCWACSQICPHKCISFQEDEEGFLYPFVNQDDCIDCGLCEKVCPMINRNEPRTPLKVYASKNPDDNIRLKSSSGGVFTLLAEKIIDEGGVVFGVKWNEKWEAVHDYVEAKDGLAAFRGSKYLQSKVGSAFSDVRLFLKEGRLVLFCGTPCQIAGLRLYLGKEYENLYTIDFICHGIPSPGVFRWYLQEELNRYAPSPLKLSDSNCLIRSIPKADLVLPKGYEIKDIRFRDKRKGWKKYGFSLDLIEENKKGENNTIKYQNQNTFLKGMNFYLRLSCYDCAHRLLRSGSDITIADYWGIQTLLPDYDDDKGISGVIVNTEKGVILTGILDNCSIETSFADLLSRNVSLEHSPILDMEKRQYIYDENLKKSFKERVDEVTKESIVVKFKKLPRTIIYGLFGENRIQKFRKSLNNVNS